MTQSAIRMGLLLCLASAVSGCVTRKAAILAAFERIDSPALNEEKVVEVGDVLLAKGELYTLPAVRLINQVQSGDGFLLKKFIQPPGVLVARSEDRWFTYFYSDNFAVYDALIGTMKQLGGLARLKTNESKFFLFSEGTAITTTPKPQPQVELTRSIDKTKRTFKQELIYNGRAGDQVKMLYREFTDDLIRGDFSQEVQYDLREGAEIGFKGARIVIVEATNQKLRYHVARSFQ
jgi:hypothetical protein